MNLIRFSCERPVTALMVYSILAFSGLLALFYMPVDLMPSGDSGVLTIVVGVRGGLPPEDIESLVTKPVEDEMATIPNLEEMISVSRKERATITLSFKAGIDSSRAALEIQERLAKIKGKLPKDIEKPIVSRYDENQAPIMILALSSKRFTPEELRDLADRELKPMLQKVRGVANVEVGGGRERKILVEFDQNRLQAYAIPIRQVIAQIGLDNINTLTGRMDRGKGTSWVRTVGAYETLEDIGNLPIAVSKEGSRLRLRDIADIRDFYLEPESYSRMNREPVVSCYIQKEALENTIATADRIKREIEKYRSALDTRITFSVVSDQSVAIEKALKNVRNSLFEGAFLAGLILVVFLRDFLTASVIFTSIPLSFLITLAVMKLGSLTLNVMTISGLALASGMVVDDSIVVLENIVQRRERIKHWLSQKARFRGASPEAEEARADPQEVAVQATGEMSLALTASTLTKVIVFLPILFLNPQVKLLYWGLAVTVTSALLISLVVSVSVIPAIAANLSPKWLKESAFLSNYFWIAFGARRARWRESWRGLLPRLVRLKDKVLRRRAAGDGDWVVTRASHKHAFKLKSGYGIYLRCMRALEPWLLPAAGFWAVLLMASASLSRWKDGFRGVVLALLAAAGLCAAAAGVLLLLGRFRAYRNFTAFLMRRRYAAVACLGLLLGGAFCLYRQLDKEFVGTTEENEFTIFVELPSGAKLDVSDKVVGAVEKILGETPEVQKSVKASVSRVEGWSSKIYVTLLPLQERTRTARDVIDFLRPLISQVGQEYNSFIYFSEPSSSKEFVIDVFGYDYGKLRELAVLIAQRLEKVPGLVDVKLRYKPGRPEVRVEVDREKASLFGFSVQEIAETLHAQIRGLRATYFLTPTAQIETVARLQEIYRKTLDDIQAIAFVSPQGVSVPVLQVAKFELSLTPSEVWRKDRERVIQVSANRGDTALSKVVLTAMQHLRDLKVPTGYYYEIGGDFPKMLETERESRFAFLLMLVLVYAVLASLFESASQPVIILVAVPMTLLGAIPLLYATQTPVTLGTLIGLIMLGGIAVSNSIILVDVFNGLKKEKSVLRALLEAGERRFRPIVMTTLTTLLGLAPLLIGRQESGSLWAPLAMTVIGGLTVSTVLVLFVLPSFYLILEDIQRWFARKFFTLTLTVKQPKKS